MIWRGAAEALEDVLEPLLAEERRRGRRERAQLVEEAVALAGRDEDVPHPGRLESRSNFSRVSETPMPRAARRM